MRFKKLYLALFACLALGAFAANAAQAAGEGWIIEGSGAIPNGTHERVKCAKHGTTTLVLTSTLLGSEIELTAEGIDCLEKAGSTNVATLDNTTSKGHGEGVLTLTGVKVVKPSTKCSVKNVGGTSGEITTEKITAQAVMDSTVGSTVMFTRLVPETAGGAFATIEFGGAECPLNEASAPVKGSACGEAVHTNAGGTGYETNLTDGIKPVTILLLGAAQQTTGGCALTLGTKAAQLGGAIDFELAGANAGKGYGFD